MLKTMVAWGLDKAWDAFISRHDKPKDILEFVKRVVCFNQGEFVQYAYLAGEKHKALKNAFRTQNADTTRIHKLCRDLSSHLYGGFVSSILKGNVALLSEYFSHREKRYHPRICVKGFNEGLITDLYRLGWSYKLSYPIESNTGFRYVHQTGTYYVCNDIPAQAVDLQYVNPRLDPVLAAHYSPSLKRQISVRFRAREDIDWIDCWRKISTDHGEALPTAESCYKSTIIIPITLAGNMLREEFRERFGITDNSKPATYGFLCVDHRNTHFFDQPADIQVGYIFADLLSLYMVVALTYTERSETYKHAVDMAGAVQTGAGE